MDNLEIIGESEYFRNVFITHKINTDFENNYINILGYKFDVKTLEKLGEWIDLYYQNTQKVITLNYKQVDTEGSETAYFFRISTFPISTNNSEWIEKVLGFTEHYQNPLGGVLSKIKNFNFVVDNTDADPKIEANHEKGEVSISKRFFYDASVLLPLITWITDYVLKKDELVVKFKIEYFNTSASKAILYFLKFLETLTVKNLKIIWLYYEDDEDMEEAGREFKALTRFEDEMILQSF